MTQGICVVSKRFIYSLLILFWFTLNLSPKSVSAAEEAEALPDCLVQLQSSALTEINFSTVLEDKFNTEIKDDKEALKWPETRSPRASIRLQRETHKVDLLALDRFYAKGSTLVERSVEISRATNGELQLSLQSSRFLRDMSKISAKVLPDRWLKTIWQNFKVNPSDCSLESNQWWIKSTGEPDQSNQVKVSEVHSETPAQVEENSVPKDFILNSRKLELYSRHPGLIRGKQTLSVYIDGKTPQALVELDPYPGTTQIFDPMSKRVQPMHQMEVSTRSGGKNIFSGTFLWSDFDEFSVLRLEDSENWIVNLDFWLHTALDWRPQNEGHIEVAFSDGIDIDKATQLTFKTNRPLEYANLRAYWKVESTSQPDSQNWIYHLKAAAAQTSDLKSELVVPEDRLGVPELRSSKWVESEDDSVKALAQLSFDKRNWKRAEAVGRILEIIHSKVEFDEDAAHQNEILPMTTSAILKKGKGVCQHFANVFVALARSVGLPARIVTGYKISDKEAIAHAWVEYQASDDGPWVPIEPQSLSTNFANNEYLPMSVSASLDDSDDDAAVAAETAAFYGLKATISSP